MPGLRGRFVCVWNCLIFFVGKYSSVGPEICHVLSQIQWRFLRGILGKNYFGRIFQKFCANQGYPLPELAKFRPSTWNLFWVPIVLKKLTQVLSYLVWTQVRRQVHKKNYKKKIRGRKARSFCFQKISFVHSRSGTYYTSLLGYFGLKFLPDVCHCVYSVLTEIWALESSYETVNKFFIHQCQGWEEGSFVCKTVWVFSWVNTHLLDLKFFAFCPKFNWDFYVEFQEKTISGEFSRRLVQTKAILYQNLWNFALVSEILF